MALALPAVLVPYLCVEHRGEPRRPEHETVVLALLARRQGHRAAREWPLADTLLGELTGLGILVDDRLKTWAWGAVLLAPSAAAAAAAPCEQAAAVAVEFADTDGDASSLQLSAAGVLQWWSGGRCFAKEIVGLVLRSTADDSGTGTHTLATSTGQPRANIPAAAVATLLTELTRITDACSATLIVRQVAADHTAEAGVQPARATGRGSKRKQESRRAELQARVFALRPPGDYASVSAPLADMGAVLAELRSRVAANGDATGGAREPFAGIRWHELPALLSMFGDGEDGNEDSEGADGAAARKRRRTKQTASGAQRLERKQRQCDAFAAAIAALDLPDGTLVADFGCGSCGLTLPLAWIFPKLNFCGIDIKKTALELMAARAEAAGLKNTYTHCGSVASFTETFGLAIALHACGQASDEAMMQAVPTPGR